MADIEKTIQGLELEIERTHRELEHQDQLEAALEVYRDVERRLFDLGLQPGEPGYPSRQNVLAYCLLRQGRTLIKLGRTAEAEAINERELEAARDADMDASLALSLLYNATTSALDGKPDEARPLLDEAYQLLLGRPESRTHRHGLGQYWLLSGELVFSELLPGTHRDALSHVNQALSYLLPVEAHAEIARAYGTRARIHDALGNPDASAADYAEHDRWVGMVESA